MILAEYIPDHERIVLIEDTAELQIQKENVLRFEAPREQDGLPAEFSRREFTSKTPILARTGTSNSKIPEKEYKNEGYIRIGGQMYVADMELLVDVGRLPASVFEEELAIENERACEEVVRMEGRPGDIPERGAQPFSATQSVSFSFWVALQRGGHNSSSRRLAVCRKF